MKRKLYWIEGFGEKFIGYLFTDNVRHWEDRGYIVTRTS